MVLSTKFWNHLPKKPSNNLTPYFMHRIFLTLPSKDYPVHLL
jgi:hypothetical protein